MAVALLLSAAISALAFMVAPIFAPYTDRFWDWLDAKWAKILPRFYPRISKKEEGQESHDKEESGR